MSTLTWIAPDYDGGLPVTAYKVVQIAEDGTRTETELDPSVLEFVYNGAVVGSIFVLAKNAVGYSQAGVVKTVAPWASDPSHGETAPVLSQATDQGWDTSTGEVLAGRQYQVFRVRNPRENGHQYSFAITAGIPVDGYQVESATWTRSLVRPGLADLLSDGSLADVADVPGGGNTNWDAALESNTDYYILISMVVDESTATSGTIAVAPKTPAAGASFGQTFEYPDVLTVGDPERRDVAWWSVFGGNNTDPWDRWFVLDSDGSPFKVTATKNGTASSDVNLDVFRLTTPVDPAVAYPPDITTFVAIAGDFSPDNAEVNVIGTAQRYWIKVSPDEVPWEGVVKIVSGA